MPDAAILGLNFTIGLLMLLSPCGYPMLPAYLAFYLDQEGTETRSPIRGGLRGLAGGTAAGLGAFITLGAIAFAAQEIGRPFKQNVLVIELVGGLVLIALGVAALAGRNLSIPLPVRATRRKGILGIAAFGALYAGVSAGCTVPVLLTVIVDALAQPTRWDAAIAIGAYAGGLFVGLVGLSVAVGIAGASAAEPLRRALPYVRRVTGVLLVIIGLYLVAYWYTDGAIGLYVPSPSF